MDLLIDFDEVICQFTATVVKFWNEDYPDRRKELSDIVHWNVADSLGPGGRDFLRSTMRYNHLYDHVLPVPGAVEGMKSLLDMGHDVLIVSSIPRSATTSYDGKAEWIRRHLPFFPLDSFVACSRKDRVRGDMLLDDGVHNLEAFRKTGRDAIAFDRPWNLGWKGPYVKDWSHFISFVKYAHAHRR